MSSQIQTISALHAIEEKLKQRNSSAELLYCRNSQRIDKILILCKKAGVKSLKVSMAEIDRLAGGSHKGAVLLVQAGSGKHKAAKFHDVDSLLESLDKPNPLIIVLDGITDPHNLGAILRSADQFDADCVIIPDVRSAGNSGVVDQTSAGASMYVPLIRVTNISREIKKLQQHDFWVYGAAMDGQDACSIKLTGKTVLVLGREGQGLHELVEKSCDGLIRIPCNGNIDSLNVSVAAGILMYECRRQQDFIYT